MSGPAVREKSSTPPPDPPRRRRLALGLLVAFVVVLAVGGTALVVGLDRGPTPVAAPVPPGGPQPSITVLGDEILRAGVPWFFLGMNSFTWSGDCADAGEEVGAQDIDAWFAGMRHDGHGAVRLFFFPGWDLDRLDAAIAAAAANNVYVTITLDNGIEGCGAEEKDAAWFRDTEKRAVYQQHLTTLLERYRGNTTIAWFEYFNEPSWAGGELRAFYDEMGAYAATIDPNRLFASGTIAVYSLDTPENFRTVSASPGVDIASLHEYDADEVESHHGPAVRANSAGKPVVVGEFGIYASTSGVGPECQADLAGRAVRLGEKAVAYTTTTGYVGAFAWAWQPGTSLDSCETGNLATDPEVQAVLRDTGAS